MSVRRLAAAVAAVALVGGSGVVAIAPWRESPAEAAIAVGVGAASWTPSRSTTTLAMGRHLVVGDATVVETTAEWSRAQRRGLARYLASGLRYTHEVNDRSGRLSATGYWATNHPDPAFDRDDDDGDGRWEEAEITAGAELPAAGRRYLSLIQFSRWRGKARPDRCGIAWDRRAGSLEVLSQLSRQLFGEWQAERYTMTYDRLPYPRVGEKPDLPVDAARPSCSALPPLDPSHEGVVVTFAAPLSWDEAVTLAGQGRWLAFEAAGSTASDELPWTCGGPVEGRSGLALCEELGVRVDGVTAVAGYPDPDAAAALENDGRVAVVEGLRDPLESLIGDLGGIDVEPPDLTVDDSWWAIAHGA